MEEMFKLIIKLNKIAQNTPIEIVDARKNIFSHENKGQFLYIYYDIDTISQIANSTNEIWFKSVKKYSDKEEYAAWKNKYFYILLELKSKKYDKEFNEIFLDTFNSYDIEEFSNKYYVFCTSYEPDNNLCWNSFVANKTYANQIKLTKLNEELKIEHLNNQIIIEGDMMCEVYKTKKPGGCICFNKSGLDIHIGNRDFLSGYLNYSSRDMTNKFFECLDIIYESYINDRSEEVIKYNIEWLIDYYNLFTKNKFYSGEKEYRYILDKRSIYLDYNSNLKYIPEHDVYALKIDKSIIDHITITNSRALSMFNDFEIKLSKVLFNEEGIIKGYNYED